MAEENEINLAAVSYGDENIIHLDDMSHIRRRPGMYIGKLGDGSHSDDGIYVLIKESIDNSIDEFRMGEGKVIEVDVEDGKVRVRDYGRGIPLGKLVEVVSVLNTGQEIRRSERCRYQSRQRLVVFLRRAVLPRW